MYEFLKKVPLFAELPDSDLERLCEMVDEEYLPAGTFLFSEGSPGNQAYVIKDGQLEILKTSSGREVLLAVRKSGEVIGEMALLEDAPRMASVRARTDTNLLSIHQEQMDHLLNSSPSAARAMLSTVLARWRSTTAMLQQSEKMAQLGTLTAGVAHELNNPAAAVKRGASQLQVALAEFEEVQDKISQLAMTPQQRTAIQELTETTHAGATSPPELDALARSDLEYELEEWLEDHGVPEPWELAPMLIDLDFEVEDLDTLISQFQSEQIPTLIKWLGATYNVHSLLNEIGQGAGRISEIVKSLKSYAYLDQAPVQAVDVHEGLDNTLVILRNKLKVGISVRREYASDLPKIQAYGSELNQVWTNILDNAIDALMEDEVVNPSRPPVITLRTRQEGDWVVVEIQDNGPGIPPEIIERVFDPFFTTKPPGKGTGMGLEISYNIIVNKHRGDIKVYSQPGFTCFQVILPVNFDAQKGTAVPVVSVPRASEDELRKILEESHTIATVGLSAQKDRPAHTVPAYLQAHGYHIIPVNPNIEEVLNENAYPDLLSVPEPVDVVQVFRPSEFVPEIVDQAIHIGAKTIWMQEGIINEQAAEVARRAGLQVVMDTCMRSAHRRLMR